MVFGVKMKVKRLFRLFPAWWQHFIKTEIHKNGPFDAVAKWPKCMWVDDFKKWKLMRDNGERNSFVVQPLTIATPSLLCHTTYLRTLSRLYGTTAKIYTSVTFVLSRHIGLLGSGSGEWGTVFTLTLWSLFNTEFLDKGQKTARPWRYWRVEV